MGRGNRNQVGSAGANQLRKKPFSPVNQAALMNHTLALRTEINLSDFTDLMMQYEVWQAVGFTNYPEAYFYGLLSSARPEEARLAIALLRDAEFKMEYIMEAADNPDEDEVIVASAKQMRNIGEKILDIKPFSELDKKRAELLEQNDLSSPEQSRVRRNMVASLFKSAERMSKSEGSRKILAERLNSSLKSISEDKLDTKYHLNFVRLYAAAAATADNRNIAEAERKLASIIPSIAEIAGIEESPNVLVLPDTNWLQYAAKAALVGNSKAAILQSDSVKDYYDTTIIIDLETAQKAIDKDEYSILLHEMIHSKQPLADENEPTEPRQVMINEGITEAITQNLLEKADVPDCKGIVAYPLEVAFVKLAAKKIAENKGSSLDEVLESINTMSPSEKEKFFETNLSSRYGVQESFDAISHSVDTDINKIYEDNKIPMAQFGDPNAYRRTPEQADLIYKASEEWAIETFDALFETK